MSNECSRDCEESGARDRLKVAVLMGGVGEERQISLESGDCVANALEEAGVEVVAVDIEPDRMEILDDKEINVFFIALHGRFGEDSELQQILEDKSLVYTGSGPAASRLAFDKLTSKQFFANAGIMVPRAIRFDGEQEPEELEKELGQIGNKFVVKPLCQGSSIGVSIVDDAASVVSAAQQCLSEFGDCMIEEYIEGREITVGLLGSQALPIIEIRSKGGFYDYEAKYLDDETEFLFDTIEDRELAGTIEKAAVASFDVLGCRHFARADFIMDDKQNVYILEVNTIPGFTSHSLLPMAAAKAGISMSDLCLRIVQAALTKNMGEVFVNPSANGR